MAKKKFTVLNCHWVGGKLSLKPWGGYNEFDTWDEALSYKEGLVHGHETEFSRCYAIFDVNDLDLMFRYDGNFYNAMIKRAKEEDWYVAFGETSPTGEFILSTKEEVEEFIYF